MVLKPFLKEIDHQIAVDSDMKERRSFAMAIRKAIVKDTYNMQSLLLQLLWWKGCPIPELIPYSILKLRKTYLLLVTPLHIPLQSFNSLIARRSERDWIVVDILEAGQN